MNLAQLINPAFNELKNDKWIIMGFKSVKWQYRNYITLINMSNQF